MQKHLLLPLIAALGLAACGQHSDEPKNAGEQAAQEQPAAPAAQHANADGQATQGPAKPATATVTFSPEAFEDCTPPKYVVAKVSWDATASGAANVDVKTVGTDGSEGMFATGAPVGTKETGAWMGPGSTIVVRNHETGEELGRAVAASKPCGG